MSDPTRPSGRPDDEAGRLERGAGGGEDPDSTRVIPAMAGQGEPTLELPSLDQTEVVQALPASARAEPVVETGGASQPRPGLGRGWIVAMTVVATLLVLVVVALATGVFQNHNSALTPTTPSSTTSTSATTPSTTSSPAVTQVRTTTTQTVTSTTTTVSPTTSAVPATSTTRAPTTTALVVSTTLSLP